MAWMPRKRFALIAFVSVLLHSSYILLIHREKYQQNYLQPSRNGNGNASLSHTTVSTEELYQKGGLNLNPRHICKCNHRVRPVLPVNRSILLKSSCSDEATLLGESQKVVSYSLYLKPSKTEAFNDRYFFGAYANVEGVKKYYPGWVMRIYSNIDLEPNNEVCNLICSDPIIYYCDTRRLPGLGSVTEIDPMRWRFLPIGDPTVEKFVVRDLDSRIAQRERDAVSEWEASNYSFHGMRDYPGHHSKIMGGMWGGHNFKIGFKTGRKLQHSIVTNPVDGGDQHLLIELIYYSHRNGILTHDSYLCKNYGGSRPFPTRRENNSSYAGQTVEKDNVNDLASPLPKCPISCRPPDHQDWEYC